MIAKFQGTHLDWQRFWGHLQAKIERGSVTRIQTVLFLMVANMSLSSGETVKTK